MKPTSLFFISTLALALTVTGCHQAPSPDELAQTNKIEIGQWMDSFVKAVDSGDAGAVMALYSPDVLAYDLIPPMQYEGTDAYGKDWAAYFATLQGPPQIEVRDLRITTSGDVAFVTSLQGITGTSKDGKKSTVWVRDTTGLRKVNGKWLDVHDHVSVPVDVTTGKGQLDLQP